MTKKNEIGSSLKIDITNRLEDITPNKVQINCCLNYKVGLRKLELEKSKR